MSYLHLKLEQFVTHIQSLERQDMLFLAVLLTALTYLFLLVSGRR